MFKALDKQELLEKGLTKSLLLCEHNIDGTDIYNTLERGVSLTKPSFDDYSGVGLGPVVDTVMVEFEKQPRHLDGTVRTKSVIHDH